MHEPLTDLLERAELAVSASRGFVEPEQLDRIATVVANGRVRLHYPEEVKVVALAGGTGSGKSSIFNALTATDAAEVGVTRPVTSTPLASVPTRHAVAMGRFLAEIGVDRTIEVDRWAGMCLIDLPDTDSVELDHRHRVESVLPRVDAMVWVVDPEKYRDAALHHRYLKPLVDYAPQLVLVLNQIDKLGPEDVAPVLADLRQALIDDGLGDVPLVPTAASPVSGPPVGMEELESVLVSMIEDPEILYTKLLTDLETAGLDLGISLGPSIPYRGPAETVVRSSSDKLAAAGVSEAVADLTWFLEELATEVGGDAADEIRGTAASLPEAVVEMAEELRPVPVRRRWWDRQPEVVSDPVPEYVSRISDLIAPVGSVMERRARAIAAATDLVIVASSVAAKSDR